MKITYSKKALDAIDHAPPAVKKAFFKQTAFLANDLRHRSLRAKKYDESQDLWQARVNKDWRFYFTIIGDTYQIEEVIPHPK
jgi:plasmid maintenance system killer protein